MEETASLTTVLETIVAMLISVGTSFKKVGGDFVKRDEVERFLKTLYTLSTVGPYDSVFTVNGGIYPLEAFKVDSRFAAAFVMPRAVLMPGASPFRKDVSVHLKFDNLFNPAEMIEFQHKFFAQFKTQPQLISVEEAMKPVILGEITDVSCGAMCHVEDLASVKSIPVELSITDQLWKDEYFNYNIADVAKMVVVNFYSGLA
jgi:hypothetical protein